MPPNRELIVGGGDDYVPAESCTVASEKFGNGGYMAHQGDPNSFLVVLAKVRDGSAAVKIAVWKCVFCHKTLIGLADADERGSHEYTWMERGEG